MFDDISVKFETVDHTIAGKMVTCRMTIPDYQMQNLDKAYVKQTMAMQIAGFMLDNNMLEYTQMRDPSSLDTHVHARCYVTPDAQVRILRTLKR